LNTIHRAPIPTTVKQVSISTVNDGDRIYLAQVRSWPPRNDIINELIDSHATKGEGYDENRDVDPAHAYYPKRN
jgi:hypothetical protein